MTRLQLNFNFVCDILIFRESGVSSSFSEMLLLIAIHFHANQVQAILDLVCSTLGMKVSPLFDVYFGCLPQRSDILVRFIPCVQLQSVRK